LERERVSERKKRFILDRISLDFEYFKQGLIHHTSGIDLLLQKVTVYSSHTIRRSGSIIFRIGSEKILTVEK